MDEEGVAEAKCNLCPSGAGKKPWETVVNATRMRRHLSEKHKLETKEGLFSFSAFSSQGTQLFFSSFSSTLIGHTLPTPFPLAADANS